MPKASTRFPNRVSKAIKSIDRLAKSLWRDVSLTIRFGGDGQYVPSPPEAEKTSAWLILDFLLATLAESVEEVEPE